MNELPQFDGGFGPRPAGSAEKCAAVVVTFNRCDLLSNCLDALGGQTRQLDGIIVVDNASSDATEQSVRGFAATSTVPVLYRRLAANVGGAGGFSYGTRLACELGFTEIWLMDDDGVPANNALEELLAVEGPAIRNALVVDIDNRTKLAFPLEHEPNAMTIADAQAVGQVANNSVNPFNGTLISSYAFDRVGYPFEGFFIWGDEVEFINRVKRAEFAVCTVTQALHYHPSNRKTPYMLFGKFQISVTDEKRLPIFMRNYSYNLYNYASRKAWLSFVAKHLLYEVMVTKSPRRFAMGVRAAIEGISSFSHKVRDGAKAPYAPAIDRSENFNVIAGKFA